MSYFNNSKRKITLKSSIITLTTTACAIALLGVTAYADPQKKANEAVKAPIETVKDATKDEAKDAAKDAGVAPMELPSDNATEESKEKPIQSDPEVKKVPNEKLPDPVIETSTQKITGETMTSPSAKLPTLDMAQSCYQQESGVLECICEGDKACADLTKSDLCDPGTSWRNEEGFGGCTKKAD